MPEPYATVEQFLSGWKPFAELAGTALAAQVLALLATDDPEERRRHLAAASDLFRLHERYRAHGMMREGRNERADRFERLLALSVADFAADIAQGRQQETLALLQYGFEFGRHAVAPRHHFMREFLCKLLDLEAGALGIKYSLYPGGLLYSSAGRTHDQMAQDMANLGVGGAPIAGGSLTRTGELAYLFDMASTAYRATTDPEAVREPVKRWVRNTGGREDLLTLDYDATRR